MSRRFTVFIDDEIVVLSVDEVWPDGGQPADPTDVDVARIMEEYGSQRRTLIDWNLLTFPDTESIDPEAAQVSVGAVGVWQNDPALAEEADDAR